MENLVIKGQITATSKKQAGDFSQEVPTKTAYIKVDDENSKKLQDFGLTKYTSRENNEDYFILKFPKVLQVFKPNGFSEKRPDLSQITVDGLETNNFSTDIIQMNIIKGNHKNNDFYRLQAIRINDDNDIKEVQPENPFGDSPAF